MRVGLPVLKSGTLGSRISINIDKLALTPGQRQRVKGRVWSVFRFFLLFGLAFVILYPVLHMLTVTFRIEEEMSHPAIVWIPRHYTLDNLKAAVIVMNYGKSVATTIMVSLISALLQMVSSALVGYGLARFQFRGRGIVFACVLFTILVPPQTVIIPTFLQFRFFDFFGLGTLIGLPFGRRLHINLLNNVFSFYLTAITGVGIRAGLCIYIFRQFFRGMPKELEDAAYIDGCNSLKTFMTVMAPNAGPAILTVMLFSVVWYWNDYFYSAMYFSALNTVATALAQIRFETMGVYNEEMSRMFVIIVQQAGSLLLIAPILLLYIVLQRYFVESIERTGIVG
jgi:multiple sugar transport system permease protein